MRPSLASTRTKIERAKEHFEYLKVLVGDFKQSHVQEVVFKYDDEATKYISDIIVPSDPPLRWAVIVGDIVHNLRSAFDHLAWQLELLAKRVPDVDTKFPVHWDAIKFNNAVKGGVPKRFPKRAWAIIERLQPYLRGVRFYRHPLYRIHEMNRRDKHQLLNLLYAVLPFPDLHMIAKDANGNVIQVLPIYGKGLRLPGKDRPKEGTVRFALSIPHATRASAPYMDVHGKYAFEVCLDETTFGRGDYLLVFLQQLIDFTEQTVEKFVRTYPSLRRH